MVGALFAFLWYNAHPAQLFMGDTGALALGATLAVVALMTGQWLLLPIVGLVFVAEALSDILQVELLQVDEAAHRPGQAHLQDGAAASPLRAARLVRDAGRVAFLPDRHPGWNDRHCVGAALDMNEITQFRCVLPPAGTAAVHGGHAAPDHMIARSLNPLRDELNAALLRNDRKAALMLAYTALARVADTLAAYRGDRLEPQQVRVHALLVELETLPLEPLPDGTVIEHGTAVTVNYQKLDGRARCGCGVGADAHRAILGVVARCMDRGRRK